MVGRRLPPIVIVPTRRPSPSLCHTCLTCCLHLLMMTMFVTSLVDAKLFSTQMSQRIINTAYGRLRGLLITLPNRTLPPVEAYLGLEYASLRGRELRFMPPTVSRTGPWYGVKTALKFRPICPQHVPAEIRSERLGRILPFLEPQQEDCLYLNVYVPLGPSPGTCISTTVIYVIISTSSSAISSPLRKIELIYLSNTLFPIMSCLTVFGF